MRGPPCPRASFRTTESSATHPLIHCHHAPLFDRLHCGLLLASAATPQFSPSTPRYTMTRYLQALRVADHQAPYLARERNSMFVSLQLRRSDGTIAPPHAWTKIFHADNTFFSRRRDAYDRDERVWRSRDGPRFPGAEPECSRGLHIFSRPSPRCV